MTRNLRLLSIASVSALALPIALAGAADRPPPGRPPQEAIDACANLQQGASCSVTLGDRTISGTCELIPQTTTLACRPDHPPGPPPGGPPAAAIAACKDRQQGASCSLTHGEHTISGTCEHGPDGNGPLACRPSGPPPQH